jgi:hypothetical protein
VRLTEIPDLVRRPLSEGGRHDQGHAFEAVTPAAGRRRGAACRRPRPPGLGPSVRPGSARAA